MILLSIILLAILIVGIVLLLAIGAGGWFVILIGCDIAMCVLLIRGIIKAFTEKKKD